MNIGSILRGLLGDAKAGEPKALELKEGQVVRGSVVSVSENGKEAIVQIQGTPVRAELEAPLRPGDSVTLQVGPPGDKGLPVLKPFSGDASALSRNMGEALASLGLSNVEEGPEIVKMLLAAQLPLTKENAAKLTAALAAKPADVPVGEWLEAAALAEKRGLPVTGESVKGLHKAIFGPPLHQLIAALEEQVQQWNANAGRPETTAGAGRAPDGAAASAGAGGQQGTAAPAGSAGQAAAGASTGAGAQTAPAPAVSAGPVGAAAAAAAAGESPAAVPGGSAGQAAGAALGAGGQTVPAPAVSAGPVGAAAAAAAAGESPAAAPGGSAGPAAGAAPGADGQTAPAPAASAGPSGAAAAAAAAGEPSAAAPGGSAGQAAPGSAADAAPLRLRLQGVLAELRAALPQLDVPPGGAAGQEARAAAQPRGEQAAGAGTPPPAAAPDGGEPWVGRLLKLLGAEHEQLAVRGGAAEPPGAGGAREAARADSLKGVLLQVMDAPDVPAALKEAAGQLVQHLTGQQLLLNTDRTAPFAQVTLFMPLAGKDGEVTASIHIQSRRGRKGELDASNCRLWFDLDMKRLGHTLVDVAVINKIVSLKIHNDEPLALELLGRSRNEIEAAVEGIGYQLSSFRTEPMPVKKAEQASAERLADYVPDPYKGVDYRI